APGGWASARPCMTSVGGRDRVKNGGKPRSSNAQDRGRYGSSVAVQILTGPGRFICTGRDVVFEEGARLGAAVEPHSFCRIPGRQRHLRDSDASLATNDAGM